jgi:hypothetical protein
MQVLKMADWRQIPVAHTYNPSYSGGRDQEDSALKPAWAGGMAQVVEHKALSSNTSTTGKKKLYTCTLYIVAYFTAAEAKEQVRPSWFIQEENPLTFSLFKISPLPPLVQKPKI